MIWYDPFEEIKKLQRDMNRLLEGFGFVSPGKGTPPPGDQFHSFREPLTDVRESDEEIIITMEIPGARKEDMELTVTEDEITVKAERKEETEEKKTGFYRRERAYRGFYRSLKLPVRVSSEKATAEYRDGLLTIRLPKKEKAEKGRVIRIR